MGGGDIEKNELIRSLGIVGTGTFNRITRITDVLELRSLDHPPPVDIETGNNSFAEHEK
jgi:hypothetical protein